MNDGMCDELDDDGNNEDAMDNVNDTTDDDDDDRNDKLRAMKAKLYKEKLCIQRENTTFAYWHYRGIRLGTNLHKNKQLN